MLKIEHENAFPSHLKDNYCDTGSQLMGLHFVPGPSLFHSRNLLTRSHLGTAQHNLSLTSGSKVAPLETFGGQERL